MSREKTDILQDNGEPAPTIPDYDLIRPIGEGGYGRVWLATNQTTGHLRAIKIVPASNLPSGNPARREIASIKRLESNGRIRHANLLRIHHVGKTADYLFYVMDPADDVSGASASADAGYRPSTLRTRLQDGDLSAENCLKYAGQLLEGLSALHGAGMVHRDVKPENCLLIDGALHLADFGLLAEDNPANSRIGTRRYMPPDQCMDMRADIYAVGLVIYEMITALPPEEFPQLGERAKQIIGTPALDRLNRLALCACEPDPQQRYPDAQAMWTALTASIEQCESKRSAGPFSRFTRVALAGVVLLTVVISFFVAKDMFREEVQQPAPQAVVVPEPVRVSFISHPFEATIYVDGVLLRRSDETPYRTPCTVDGLPARKCRLVFQHKQQPADLDIGYIDLASTRRLVARWPNVTD